MPRVKTFEAMWMACATQEEIAEAVQITRQAITKWIDGTENAEGFATIVSKNQSGKIDEIVKNGTHADNHIFDN
jgi:predicted transcriptional regulator